MAKNSVRDFDATAANNTDIQSVDIAENCAPSGINNAIRELMADIKNVSTGTIALESPSADSLTVTGDLTVDTNTLYVDSTNNNVGIGTASPASLIHGMSGDLFLTANSTSADSGQGVYFQSTTSGWTKSNAHGAIFGKRVDGSNGYLRFDTRSGGTTAERMRINSSGNVGIGVVPETWLSSYDALQIGASGSIAGISSGNENVSISSNAYIATDGNYKYIATNEASRYLQSAGVHYFSNVASGTADTNITWNDRMVIDASGNLLVGTTDTLPASNNDANGFALRADGNFQASRSGAACARFNRGTSDGEIMSFHKDGTTVGSIGGRGSTLYVGSGDTNLKFISGTDKIHPATTDGADRDNAITLGDPTVRFKDLYLGGGAYIGGTGSANYLDDYEEGTFTPTYIGNTTNPTVTYERQNGHYVKIGRQVIATVELRTTSVSGGSGNIYVDGLPFTPVTVSGQARSGTANVGYTSTFNGSNPQSAYINGDYNAVILMTNSGTDARGPLNTAISISNLNTGGGSNFLMLTAIYIAD